MTVSSRHVAVLVSTSAPASVVLVRLAVGSVFLTEGVQKFLDPTRLGPGRFSRAGVPAADLAANADGVFEIGCGALLLVGLLTRLAAMPMMVNMVGALGLTKIPILWGGSGLFAAESGVWAMLHEARLDLTMLLSLVYLLLVGAGRLSFDARLVRIPSTVVTAPA